MLILIQIRANVFLSNSTESQRNGERSQRAGPFGQRGDLRLHVILLFLRVVRSSTSRKVYKIWSRTTEVLNDMESGESHTSFQLLKEQ